MKGYKPGTKCVITWSVEGRHIGEIVVVGDRLIGADAPTQHPNGRIVWLGMVCQELREHPSTSTGRIVHPVDWMRPLEDPDTHTIPEHEELEA